MKSTRTKAKSNSSADEKRQLVLMLKQDLFRMDVLKTIKKIKTQNLWVAGGFVRNLVWDKSHSYKHRSELGDIDVFYFDSENKNKNDEQVIRERLLKIMPNINWSVKNQARMHLHDKNDHYLNLEDALTKFPETASAVAVRLNEENNIEILAPLGLTDLFALKVRPTPSCRENKFTYKRYLSRQADKKWKEIWHELSIEK